MVTLMFEQSLQAVNPKVTLPYWDFTIDAYLVEKLHNNDYSYLRDVSDLWTPEWFGGVDPVDFQVRRCVAFVLITNTGWEVVGAECLSWRGSRSLYRECL